MSDETVQDVIAEMHLKAAILSQRGCLGAAGDWDEAADRIEAAMARRAPLAWCSLTQNGAIAYFDGKPMIMPGKVGNEHHPTPLYVAPPAAPPAAPVGHKEPLQVFSDGPWIFKETGQQFSGVDLDAAAFGAYRNAVVLAAQDDIQRLVRALDIALNGEAGAARQASLCDIVAQVETKSRALGGLPILAAAHCTSDPRPDSPSSENVVDYPLNAVQRALYRFVETTEDEGTTDLSQDVLDGLIAFGYMTKRRAGPHGYVYEITDYGSAVVAQYGADAECACTDRYIKNGRIRCSDCGSDLGTTRPALSSEDVDRLIDAADKLQRAYHLMDADPDFIRLRAALAAVQGEKA